VQTATVVGPQGDEIFTDKYGRVKVQFNWDRDGQNDANSSCWLRVATLWAGKQWGSIFIPRIGQEVVVDFIEGDPDAPIIIGSVYNQSMMPTYTLPDDKTRSGIRSMSTTQGATANFNEIRFEDKKGSEQLFINAEKDLDFRVENDARYSVGQNKHSLVKGYVKEEIDGNVDRLMKGALSEKVQGALSLQVGSNRNTKVSSAEALEAGTTMYLKAGSELVLEAGSMLTLKVGGSFITLSSASVVIVGESVMINSGGPMAVGVAASPIDPVQPPDDVDDGTK
jgi:type VI secretion system secreted protein VgrG